MLSEQYDVLKEVGQIENTKLEFDEIKNLLKELSTELEVDRVKPSPPGGGQSCRCNRRRPPRVRWSHDQAAERLRPILSTEFPPVVRHTSSKHWLVWPRKLLRLFVSTQQRKEHPCPFGPGC